jgi:MFS family permease
MTADYTALQSPIMLGSLAVIVLPFLLPFYAQQLGASAVGIGGLFAVAQFMIVLCRPLIGWALDRWGRQGFFVAGTVCYAGAMGCFALASSMVVLYLAQLLHGLANALVWTSAYTITSELTSEMQRGQAVGRVDAYAGRGALYGMLGALVCLTWLPLSTAWRVLFLGYIVLAVIGSWLAWQRTPRTRPRHQPPVWRRSGFSWAFMRLVTVAFLGHLFSAMVQPIFFLFVQDNFTADVQLLGWSLIPAALIDTFLPSRLGKLSDHYGRKPLIITGLVGVGLSMLCLPGVSHLAWAVGGWTVRALGLVMAMPSQKALISDTTSAAERGTGYGWFTGAAGLGKTVGPLLGGWLYGSVGQAVPFYCSGLALLASPVWVLLLLRGQILQEVLPEARKQGSPTP